MVSTESIKVSKKTKKALDKQKLHKRESYDNVIERILNNQMKGGKEI